MAIVYFVMVFVSLFSGAYVLGRYSDVDVRDSEDMVFGLAAISLASLIWPLTIPLAGSYLIGLKFIKLGINKKNLTK